MGESKVPVVSEGNKRVPDNRKIRIMELYFNSDFSNKRRYVFYQATMKMVERMGGYIIRECLLFWMGSDLQGQITSFGSVELPEVLVEFLCITFKKSWRMAKVLWWLEEWIFCPFLQNEEKWRSRKLDNLTSIFDKFLVQIIKQLICKRLGKKCSDYKSAWIYCQTNHFFFKSFIIFFKITVFRA